MQILWHDLRYGARTLLKQPSATLMVGLMLALGISARSVTADEPLIPRRALFADEDKLNVRLSPDGLKLIWLAPLDDTQGVWMCPVDKPAEARLLFQQTDAPVLNLQWAYNSTQLVYLKRVAKDVHLFVFDLADGQTRQLTTQAGVSARIEKLSPSYPEEILIGLNGRAPQRYDLHRINLRTGARQLVWQNDAYDRFLCDDALRPRIARRQTAEQGYELFRLNVAGQ